MLTKLQEDVLALITTGEKIVEVSRVTGVPRSNIYYWLKNDKEFIAELHRLEQLSKLQAEQYIRHRLDIYLNNIDKIANMKEGEIRAVLRSNEYMINRILGTPTNVVQSVESTDSNNSGLSKEDLSKELEEFDEE